VPRAAALALFAACLALAASVVPVCASDRAYLCDAADGSFFGAVIRDPMRGYYPARPGSMLTEFFVPKPPEIRRVFVLGAEAAARSAGPGGLFSGEENVEVINAGMPLYNSRRVLDIVRELPKFQPDIAVIMTGNNDFPRLEPCPDFLTSLKIKTCRFSPYCRDAAPQDREASASVRIFEDNLDKMCSSLKEKGVRVVFCTLPANVRDMPPAGDLLPDIPLVAEALVKMERGDFKGTADAFLAAAALSPDRAAMLDYMAGKAYLASGDKTSAKKYFRIALEKDKAGGRSDESRNEAVRRAAINCGAALVDIDAELRGRIDGEYAGDDVFYDAVRWHAAFTPYFSDLVLDAALPGAVAGQEASVSFKEGLSAPFDPAEFRDIFADVLVYCGGLGGSEGLSEQLMSRLEYLRRRAPALLESHLASYRQARAFAESIMADKGCGRPDAAYANIDALWPLIAAHMGELCRRHREYARALAFFDESLNRAPGNAFVRFYRGWTRALAGNSAAAEADFAGLSGRSGEAGANIRRLLLTR